MSHFTDLPINQPAVPKPLPEMPTPTGDTVEEAEFEEVANAEVGNSAEVGREQSGKVGLFSQFGTLIAISEL